MPRREAACMRSSSSQWALWGPKPASQWRCASSSLCPVLHGSQGCWKGRCKRGRGRPSSPVTLCTSVSYLSVPESRQEIRCLLHPLSLHRPLSSGQFSLGLNISRSSLSVLPPIFLCLRYLVSEPWSCFSGFCLPE